MSDEVMVAAGEEQSVKAAQPLILAYCPRCERERSFRVLCMVPAKESPWGKDITIVRCNGKGCRYEFGFSQG